MLASGVHGHRQDARYAGGRLWGPEEDEEEGREGKELPPSVGPVSQCRCRVVRSMGQWSGGYRDKQVSKEERLGVGGVVERRRRRRRSANALVLPSRVPTPLGRLWPWGTDGTGVVVCVPLIRRRSWRRTSA